MELLNRLRTTNALLAASNQLLRQEIAQLKGEQA
jgi:hypothetical protein